MDEQKDHNSTLKKEEAHSNPTQRQASQPIGKEISGNKRTHGSKGSELDKGSPTTTTENQLSIIIDTPTLEDGDKWRKRKGEKNNIFIFIFIFHYFWFL